MKITIPEYFNIGVACTRPHVKEHRPGATAIIVDTNGQTEQCTYEVLNLRSNQAANVFQSMEASAGERIMLCLPNCMAFPEAFFGILKLGAIAVPCSALLSPDELDYLAQDSGAHILVTTLAHWQKLQSLEMPRHQIRHLILIDSASDISISTTETLSVHHWQSLREAASPAFKPCKTKAQDPAYLVYTSGTTGYPKGVLHAHRALLGRLPAAHEWFAYQTEPEHRDRILHSGKFNWTYVLGTALMDPLFQGKSVVVYEGKVTPDTWPDLIAKYQCTIFIGVPSLYRQILQKSQANAEQVPSLRHCMCAGEHLSEELFHGWLTRFGLTIYEAIGMSECSYYLSQHADRKVKPGSAGFVQSGHQVSLLDEDLLPVTDEQEGMLCIHRDDPGLFLRYWKQEHATEEVFKEEYFLTGDYAVRDKEGYYWFHGRKDDLINSFGYRISPHEIERALKNHPDIADCVALEETLNKDKRLVVACLILKDESKFNSQELNDYALQHLAQYKVPKKFYLMASFPKTSNGKVLRKALRNTILNKST